MFSLSSFEPHDSPQTLFLFSGARNRKTWLHDISELIQIIRTSKEGFIVCVFDTMAHSDIFHLTQRHFQKIDIVCKRKIEIRKKLQGCQREPGKLHLRACSSSYLHQVDRNMPKEITFFFTLIVRKNKNYSAQFSGPSVALWLSVIIILQTVIIHEVLINAPGLKLATFMHKVSFGAAEVKLRRVKVRST